MVGRVPAQLSTPKLCKPFRIRFYAKRARKSFRFRFYEKHRGVGYCRRPHHRGPLATSACPLVFMTLRIPLFAFPPISIYISMIFMHLQIPFPAKASFSHPYKTPRVSPANTFRIFRCSCTQTYQALCFHTLAHSLSSSKKSSALESATSILFCKNTRVGDGLSRAILGINDFQPRKLEPEQGITGEESHTAVAERNLARRRKSISRSGILC